LNLERLTDAPIKPLFTDWLLGRRPFDRCPGKDGWISGNGRKGGQTKAKLTPPRGYAASKISTSKKAVGMDIKPQ
jgi:hypothetical protein